MKGTTLRKQWLRAGCLESLLASLKYWDSLIHEKPSDRKPWASILHVGKSVGVTGEPYGRASRAHRVKNLTRHGAFCETLRKAVEGGLVQTQEYLFLFHFSFTPCSFLRLSNMVFVTKAGDSIGVCELPCSLSLSFLPQPLRKTQCDEDDVSCICWGTPLSLQFIESEADNTCPRKPKCCYLVMLYDWWYSSTFIWMYLKEEKNCW